MYQPTFLSLDPMRNRWLGFVISQVSLISVEVEVMMKIFNERERSERVVKK